MTLIRVARSLTLLIVFGLLSHSAWAVDIEETIWGFDGRIVPHQFNPVSLLVSNTTEEPVGIKLELRQTDGSSNRLGAKVQEDVFLSPFSSRWVQFYPYITNANLDWIASWGLLPSQRKDLTVPNVGGPARVALVDLRELAARRQGKVKSFPEELFPPFVSATNTLEAVFLDHNPRWQEPRRLSLLQWVQRGGTLFVTPSENGEYPEFTGEMAILNQPVPRSNVGQGQVVRCADRADAVRQATAHLGPPKTGAFSTESWSLGENVFQTLKSITMPQHNWWVINIMSIIYVGLVFPGWYFLAKRSTHYRTTILAFIGLSLFFTFVFNLVGRRGYGESTAVNSLAIARKVEGNLYDVTSWTNVFVTGGDYYELKFDGQGHLYSTPYSHERVAGLIDNGVDGAFLADIPLFSSRAFLHRGLMTGPSWNVQVVDEPESEREAALSMDALKLQVTPEPRESAYLYAVAGKNLYTLVKNQDHYKVRRTNKTVDGSLLPQEFRNDYRYRYRAPPRSIDVDSAYSRLTYASMWLAMDRSSSRESGRPLAADSLRVFIFDSLPEGFSVRHPDLAASQGRALYSMDVRLSQPLDLASQEEGHDDDENWRLETAEEGTEMRYAEAEDVETLPEHQPESVVAGDTVAENLPEEATTDDQ